MSEFPQAINPPALGTPKGYANGMLAPLGAHWLSVAGQIGWDASQQLVGPGLVEQFAQALRNVRAVLEFAGGKPEHLMRLTIYVVDKADYVENTKSIGAQYREILGRNFPAMALVQVADLLETGALVEISADAAIPAVSEIGERIR